MYIVAIAWLYVTLMMAATERSVVAGILTFLFYGLIPCALFIWLFSTPQRRRNRLAKDAEEADSIEQPLDQPDRTDP
jgi:biotin transporter BioY